MTTKSKTNAFLAALVVAFLALFGWSAAASADTSDGYAVDKFDTTFIYQGGNSWTVVTHVPNAALHNIGSKQSWLCNSNFVGEGIEPCVPERAYTTNGDIQADGRSCVYIQGDNPAWDTVPNTEKEVCTPNQTPSPEPTETETSTPTPEPSGTATTPPGSTPSPEPSQPEETPSPGPSSTQTPPVSNPSPEPTSTPSTSPVPQVSGTPTPQPSTAPAIPTLTSDSPAPTASATAKSGVRTQLAATGLSDLSRETLILIAILASLGIIAGITTLILVNRKRD